MITDHMPGEPIRRIPCASFSEAEEEAVGFDFALISGNFLTGNFWVLVFTSYRDMKRYAQDDEDT